VSEGKGDGARSGGVKAEGQGDGDCQERRRRVSVMVGRRGGVGMEEEAQGPRGSWREQEWRSGV
jgi:hypothetical protein